MPQTVRKWNVDLLAGFNYESISLQFLHLLEDVHNEHTIGYKMLYTMLHHGLHNGSVLQFQYRWPLTRLTGQPERAALGNGQIAGAAFV